MSDHQGTQLTLKHPIVRSFFYFARCVTHPVRAFTLLQSETSFMPGFFLNALKWVLAEFYVYYLYRTNQVFFIPPWLAIPVDSFRYYLLFYYIPYGIVFWILVAGVVQTLSMAFRGKGSFTATLNIVGIMIFTPFVFIDTIDALFMILNGGNWAIVFNSITRSVMVAWGAALLTLGLRVMHGLSLVKAIAIAILVSAFSIFVNVIFVR